MRDRIASLLEVGAFFQPVYETPPDDPDEAPLGTERTGHPDLLSVIR